MVARRISNVACGRFSVRVVPVLRDNFSFIIHDGVSKKLALVDVSADYEPVLREATDLLSAMGEVLSGATVELFATHKHHDHIGGFAELQKRFPKVRTVGGANEPVPGKTEPVRDGQRIKFGELCIDVLETPCHTPGHVLYHFYHPEATADGCVFTGDTIFIAGLGAFNEGGTAKGMISAMQRAAKLPPATRVFCGHEYTENFLKNSKTVLGADNEFLNKFTAHVAALRAEGLPSVPSLISDELRVNPFMMAAVGDKAVLSRLPPAAVVSAEAAMQHLYDTCP